ncbi:GFA family protein [Phenylobacterium sp.]|uniref:GFA family protein n=1 Tax=Phenylobacterium sp. TaxID=1871053 RepID=UPI0025E7EDD3|nr:GFA family protein [Phenylobacterium sp.]MBX3485375.1 GFA family protein [Phenylobacterium sp.]MCW5758642.1 GFA family protein [Phenylobacterium sp.]
MTRRTATCACGQVRVTCEGEPLKVSLCHCRECQRRTGGPFGVAAFFPREAVAATGETREFRRPSDSGFDLIFRFCPACGSTVWWEALRMPDRIAVAAGAFADPDFPPPGQAVYREHRHAWIPEDLI